MVAGVVWVTKVVPGVVPMEEEIVRGDGATTGGNVVGIHADPNANSCDMRSVGRVGVGHQEGRTGAGGTGRRRGAG